MSPGNGEEGDEKEEKGDEKEEKGDEKEEKGDEKEEDYEVVTNAPKGFHII